MGKILYAGIGTGILSIVAAKLGAENIIGVDINDESIKEAQENIKINNVTKGRLFVGGMSVPHDEVVISTFIENGLLEYVRYRDEEWSVALLQKP